MAAAAPLSSEPKTPFWLTCVGAGLFFLAGLFLVFRAPAQPRPEKVAAVAPTPSAANTAAPAGAMPPGAAMAPGRNNMDPEAMKRLQDRLRQAPGGGAPKGAPPPAGAH